LTIVVAVAASTAATAVAAKAIELMLLPLQNPKDEANGEQLKKFKI
jgi:hypothetical protein